MSDTVKLIIEIPKAEYERLVYIDHLKLRSYIENGTPLDNNSERAEAQAYFGGEAYGWEQGRKALIDDVKAEITKPHDIYLGEINSRSNVGILAFGYEAYDRGIKHVIEILDNIGKAESEDKE